VSELAPEAQIRQVAFGFTNEVWVFVNGKMAFVDKNIGRVLELVAASPWGKSTIVVVTSDHGEAFGEHGMIRHGFELWEGMRQVHREAR